VEVSFLKDFYVSDSQHKGYEVAIINSNIIYNNNIISITMHWSTVSLVIAIACSISPTIRTVNSFQLQPQRSSIKSRCVQTTQSSIILYELATSTVDPIVESAASQWMEKEKRLEDEMDDISNDTKESTNDEQLTSSTINNNTDDTPHYTEGRWESLHGNYILRPPPSIKPRALIHFLGGALLGAAPQLTYRYLLERLSSKGYLVVATPYQLSFDHLVSCDEIIDKFEVCYMCDVCWFTLCLVYITIIY